MMRLLHILAAFLVLCALPLQGGARAETTALPLSIDSQLLTSMVIKAAYTDEGRTAVLAGHRGGCKEMVLSEPRYTVQGDKLHFETRVFIKAGFGIGSTCFVPVSWEGILTLTQVPVIDRRWVLSFRTLESALYDEEREPARVVGFFWNLIKTHVFAYLDEITINLAPPVEDLRLFTADLFPPDLQERAHRMIDSFRPGKVNAGGGKIAVEILAEIDPTEVEKGGEQPLDEEVVERFISIWETWDAYFVKMIGSLPKGTLSVDERQLILDVLLEARHRFEEELLEPGEKTDFVRREFVSAWGRLSPIFRRQMSDDPDRPLFDYLAFFTASDALVALDTLGPALGIEISRSGLIHLARLITSKEISDLPYEFAVDEDLRAILGLGEPLPHDEPTLEEDSIDIEPEGFRNREKGWLLSLRSFFAATAWARTDPVQPFRDRITPWLAPKGDLQPYLQRVRSLLNDVSNRVFPKTDLDRELRDFYNLLVLSTAWQETCFRQFVVRGGKATYLRSYNRTSVGIMQINERVWRGIYDVNHLRWDIAYNATAGCEILGIYLKNYALPQMREMDLGKGSSREGLAWVAYAVYSGGPAQLPGSVKRLAEGAPNIFERLFLEKYQWVRTDQWDKIEICL